MKHILVIKHGALGDMVQAVDAFASLRVSFAQAHICLMTGPIFARLFSASDWFDDIFIDSRQPAWHLMQSYHIRHFLRKEWDMVIDLQCSHRTSHYHKMTRKGTDWYGIAQGCSHPMPDFTGIHNRERMLTAVVMAGADKQTASLRFLTDQPLSSVIASDLPHSFCLFFAGSSLAKPSKRWPSKHFSALARQALSKGITPLLCGTSTDRAVNLAIKKAVPAALDLTSMTSIADLAILASRAKFSLGNDTGPVFLAARTDSPCLMLMGSDTHPALSAPTGKKARYLYSGDLSALSVEQVWAELQALAKF